MEDVRKLLDCNILPSIGIWAKKTQTYTCIHTAFKTNSNRNLLEVKGEILSDYMVRIHQSEYAPHSFITIILFGLKPLWIHTAFMNCKENH